MSLGDDFFADFDNIGHYVPSKVGDTFRLEAPGYSYKKVYVVFDVGYRDWEMGMSLALYCHVVGEKPDARGYWPSVWCFPCGTIDNYANGGQCFEVRVSTEKNDTDPEYTVTNTISNMSPTDTKDDSTLHEGSQEQSDKPLSPSDLHPLLVCDIDYRPNEYEWPPLPKLDVGPPPLEIGLFDPLADFFRDLDNVEEEETE